MLSTQWLSLGPDSSWDLSHPEAELSQPSPAHQSVAGLQQQQGLTQCCACILSEHLFAKHISFKWK